MLVFSDLISREFEAGIIGEISKQVSIASKGRVKVGKGKAKAITEVDSEVGLRTVAVFTVIRPYVTATVIVP